VYLLFSFSVLFRFLIGLPHPPNSAFTLFSSLTFTPLQTTRRSLEMASELLVIWYLQDRIKRRYVGIGELGVSVMFGQQTTINLEFRLWVAVKVVEDKVGERCERYYY